MKRGFADEAEDAGPHKHPVYYTPHQAVVRQEGTTTRQRVVFHESPSASGCLSSNDRLCRCVWEKGGGAHLNPVFANFLIKLRMYRFAIAADIDKSFFQVALSHEDEEAFRSSWCERTPKQGKRFTVVATWKRTRVLFGVTSCPFLLAATVRHHLRLQDEYAVTTKVLKERLYADELVTGADSTNEAIVVCGEPAEILEMAGVRLRKWNFNEQQ